MPTNRDETATGGPERGAGGLKISCIICTFNRVEYLKRVLEGMLGQTLSRSEFEIVLVNDGSTEDVDSVVRTYATQLPITYISQENSGLAAAKNAGVAAARAPVVLFMDDDDVPAASLLQEHLKTHASFPESNFAVLGHTNLHPNISDRPLMRFVTEVGCQLFCYGRTTEGAILDYTWFWGGRSSCKRALLANDKLFNPVFRFGCEDIELGYRLSSQGLKVVYNRRAVSTMLRALSLDEFCRRTEMQGRSNYVFSRMHRVPEIQAWTGVDNALDRWRLVEPRFEQILATARRMDAMANARVEHGIELDETFMTLLHRAYFEAIDASRLKGIVFSLEADKRGLPDATAETAPAALAS